MSPRGAAERQGSHESGVQQHIHAQYKIGRSLDTVFRTVKDLLLDPAARKCPLSPNAVTLISFCLGICSALALANTRSSLALMLFVVNRIADGLDGATARAQGKSSDFGGYLDIICDFTVYASLPIARVLSLSFENWNMPDAVHLCIISAVLEAAFFVNAASLFCLSAIFEKRAVGARATGEATSVTMADGLIGGSEAIIFFCFVLLAPEAWLSNLYSVFASCVLVTVVQRLRWAYSVLGKDESGVRHSLSRESVVVTNREQ